MVLAHGLETAPFAGDQGAEQLGADAADRRDIAAALGDVGIGQALGDLAQGGARLGAVESHLVDAEGDTGQALGVQLCRRPRRQFFLAGQGAGRLLQFGVVVGEQGVQAPHMLLLARHGVGRGGHAQGFALPGGFRALGGLARLDCRGQLAGGDDLLLQQGDLAFGYRHQALPQADHFQRELAHRRIAALLRGGVLGVNHLHRYLELVQFLGQHFPLAGQPGQLPFHVVPQGLGEGRQQRQGAGRPHGWRQGAQQLREWLHDDRQRPCHWIKPS